MNFYTPKDARFYRGGHEAINFYNENCLRRRSMYEYTVKDEYKRYVDEINDRGYSKIENFFNPDLVLFYGWSWKIHEEIYGNYMSVMLHPSDLPKFRGGSPIQNQIISGVLDSKVTLFVVNEGYDAGQILTKGDLSLRGRMQDIFDRLTFVGTELTMRLISSPHAPFVASYEQDHTAATYYKRRTPKESEITVEEMLNKSAEFLYNKIRMLEDPYPNAYIRTSDGKKLLIKMAEIEE